MFSIEDLTEMFNLFPQGLAVGGILSGMFFIVGFTINSIISWFKKA